jgi:hypothetical protein
VAPAGFNFGRGTRYVAAQETMEGDVLFSVPFVDVLNLHSARQGRVRALLDANADLPASIALAIHLLEERFRGDASRFHAYIETLPTGSAALNSTLFYEEDEMAMLRGSLLQRVTVGRAQAISDFFDALVGPVTSLALDPPLFTKDEFTKENFAWAMGTVWARAFSPTGADEDAMLAPILDTIGLCVDVACAPSRVEWDREVRRVIVYATQDYAAGDEVLLHIGDHKPSTLLMLNHGIARPQPFTEAETFDLSIFLDPSDALIDVKTHLLESHNMSISGSYTLRYKSKQLDADMVRSLKLKLLSPAELGKHRLLLGSASGEDDEVPIVSVRNEYVFTRAIVFACKNLLANYETTLDHDRALLREREAHSRDRRVGIADKKTQMLRALVIEKEILHHTMALAMAHWSELLTLAEPTFLEK